MKQKLIIGLILLVSGVKLINLLQVPLFGDEATYCYGGYEIINQGLATSLTKMVREQKIAPLLSIIQAGVLKTLPAVPPIAACRSVSVIASAATAVLVFWLTQSLAAGLFYAINPFSFFNDRTSLQEPLLNLWITGMIVGLWYGVRLKRWRLLWLTVVSTGLAFLTKLTTVMVVPGLVLGLLLINKAKWRYRLAFAAALVLTIMAMIIWARQETDLLAIFGYHTYSIFDLTRTIVRAKTNLWLTWNWYYQYLGMGFFVLMAVGLWKMWREHKLALVLPAVMYVGLLVALGDNYFPRLLLVTLPFAAVAVGDGVKNKLGVIIFGLMLISFVINDYRILFKPETAVIAKEDRYQFFEDWTSGAGTKAAVEYMRDNRVSTRIWVPEEIKAMWIVNQLTYAPKSTWTNEFYDVASDITLKPAIVVSTSQHRIYVGKLLFASHGEARNSVRIEEVF